MEERVKKLEAKLAQANVDAILVTGQKNIYYLTGFWGSAGTVFISQNHRLFLTDARYALIAKQTIKGFEIIETRSALTEIVKMIEGSNIKQIGFDKQVSFAFYQTIKELFSAYELLPLTNFIEKLRIIKDASEIALIRKACQISDQAFVDALDFIKPGKTELEVANFLDFRMRELGASGISFETIVASGYRSSMPHGVASQKVIENGETLTLDFGCIYQHYVSDMTRTIHIGQVSDEERAIYDVVYQSNQQLIKKAKAGLSYQDYDGIARDVITKAGYGPYFTHGIGHGMGLDVHELPFFGKSDKTLKAGMVITDEPGIYLEGKYGVRIEDDLLITETGCEVLTNAPKELIVL
ncbi:M24 family metallopeptidase [Streptococcus sp. CSL10205-OR2]|uniref:M24 family metallopeptidase n=1 Tax=Streptococcus sp. CSL10205-OR2 TaxID=2980558 RepID=UPI0021DAD86C|nr:Xaa-Pro peptidase family protein [Streptococcus sp. CSL10205-OR2]MCU9533977.1 Xaa-Pro peptidase family protein [Streptococcus sp. CSL10205-OR2]